MFPSVKQSNNNKQKVSFFRLLVIWDISASSLLVLFDYTCAFIFVKR